MPSIHDVLDLHRRALRAKGFRVDLKQDGLVKWAAEMKATDWTYAHPLSREHNHIHAGNSFSWFVYKGDERASMVALRTYEGEWNLQRLIDSGRMSWSADEALKRGKQHTLELPLHWPPIAGRIFHMGGLQTERKYRGNHLGWHLARMIRWTGMEEFGCDHVFGLERTHIAKADMWKYYGYPRPPVKIAIQLEWDEPHDFYLTYMSRDETWAAWPEEERALLEMLGRSHHADPQFLVGAL